MSNFIDLARRFHKLSSTEMTDPDHLAMLSEGRFGSSMSWEDALDNPRLILLAEAGSGKTRELRERAARMTRGGKCVFFVPLEALSADRLEDILPPAQFRSFNEWKAAADQPGWFFLDAVDELKLKAGNLERAVIRLAKSVDGELHRCRFIISSRPNDWRPETDRAVLEEHLPLVARDEVADAETYFLSPFRGSSLKKRRSRQAAPETRSVWQPIVLLPFSVDQTRAYAHHLGLSDPTAFLAEVDRKDAWTFARRPFDLHDLVIHWQATGTIGTRMQQHEMNITSKLREDPDKPGTDILSPEMARQGAERLALALQLTRCRTVRSVDLMPEADHDDGILDPDLPLPDWRLDERQSLLRRAVFDPATYGRIRFHHRSVQEYLAARRLLALSEQGAPRSAIRRMLFADRYGNCVLIPSMRPVTAWLSLWDPDILQAIIDREPEVLLAHGDPEQLTISSRARLLEAFVSDYGTGGWRGLDISSDNLQRLAHRDLGECIRTLWASRPENHDIYDLLAKLVLMGKVGSCGDLMYDAALSPDFNDYIRIVAIRAIVACRAEDAAGAIATSMVTTPEAWPARVIFDAVEDLFPDYMSVEDLLALVRRVREPKEAVGAPLVLEALVKASPAAGLGQGSMHTLESALTVLVDSGYAPDLVRDHVEHAFQSEPTGPYALTWLEALFRLAPERGLATLSEHLEKLGNASNETRAAPFAYLFGDRRGVVVKAEPDVQARILGELVRLAYRHVRREDDQTHEGTFSPDARDDAQSARNHLLSALIATPGPETCKVLQELASEHDFAHFRDRLRILARERAAEDTEFAPYGKDELVSLEKNRETVRTKEEFFALVIDRIAEIEEFYQHHPFTNRSTIASITDEEEMQRTLAGQLELRANGAYAVMRETEVADRKRTDIQLLAKDGLQAVIEVKLGNRDYSINDLEHALEYQLVQQYLRSDVCRAGALVLTDHGTGRTWVHPGTRKKLGFSEAIAYLQAKAASLAIATQFKISIGVLGLRLGAPDLVPAQRAKATKSSRSKTSAAA